jgi:hypothetical protein
MAPGDTAAYTRKFWEVKDLKSTWYYMTSNTITDSYFSGKSSVILDLMKLERKYCKGFRYDGRSAWGKLGVYNRKNA